VFQYLSLVKKISEHLHVDIGACTYHHLKDITVRKARDTVYRERQVTEARLITAMCKVTEELRQKTEDLRNLLRSVLLQDVAKNYPS